MRLTELHVNSIDLKRFESDCKPFLDAIKGTYQLPWHGSYNGPSDWEKRDLDFTRGPRDTPHEVHDSVNDFFEEKFGWRARSQGIFVTGNSHLASTYGKLFIVIPAGEFHSLWSPDIADLTSELYQQESDLKHGPERIQDHDTRRRRAKVATIEAVKKAKWHYDSQLKEALKTANEIILGSKSFYIFNHVETWADTVRPFLLNKGYLTDRQ